MPDMDHIPWEYIYYGRMNFNRDLLGHDEQMSLSNNAVQRSWFIRSEFPFCPAMSKTGKYPIKTYAENIIIGEKLFFNNSYQGIILNTKFSNKDQSLLVLVQINLKKTLGYCRNYICRRSLCIYA